MTAGEITSLAWDSSNEGDHVRVAIGIRLGVEVWTLSPEGQLSQVFAADLVAVPGSIHFVDNSTRDVQVFGVWDGAL